MKYCVAFYINNKQRIGIVSLYQQLLQNDSRVADCFKFRNHVEEHCALGFSTQSSVSLHTNDTN